MEVLLVLDHVLQRAKMLAASSDVWRLKTQRLREICRSKTFKGRAFADGCKQRMRYLVVCGRAGCAKAQQSDVFSTTGRDSSTGAS